MTFVLNLLRPCNTIPGSCMIRSGRDVLAVRIDSIFRVLMPLIVYPMSTLGIILSAAFESVVIGPIFCLLGITLPILAGVYRVRALQREFEREKARLSRALAAATEEEIDDSSEAPLLRDAFNLFDLDKNGTIDSGELLKLFSSMYPSCPRSHKVAAHKLAQLGLKHNEDGVNFTAFDDVILTWREYMIAHDPDGEWRKPRRPKVMPEVMRHGRFSQVVEAVATFRNGKSTSADAI